MKLSITGFFVFAFLICVNAQTSIDSILSQIEKNNKTLLANTQYWEAQKLQYRTGISLYNPTVEYDYLVGSPAGAGNQTEFTIAQSLDFPTAYVKKNQLAKQQIAQAEMQLAASRQDILLEAKEICIELVYRNNLNIHLSQRKQSTEKLLIDFKTRLDKGEGNILEVNKAQIQFIEVKKEFQENISAINQLHQKLVSFNGGVQITLADTSYPTPPVIPAFEQLEQEFENADPLRKILEQEMVITQKQVEVNRTLSWPKMEAGYHYQGILGQTYNGIHTGISIPLWEHKNTVKFQKSRLLFAELELQHHRTEHYYEIKQLYEKYLNLGITLAEYKDIFRTSNNSTLLNKALAAGQISAIEYFMELNYYTAAFNNYLQIEKEYHEVIAKLYKFTL